LKNILVIKSLLTSEIAVLNKYDNCDEAYLSLKEAIFHAAVAKNVKAEIVWINADDVEACKDNKCLNKLFENIDGLIVPGGFDVRGVEGNDPWYKVRSRKENSLSWNMLRSSMCRH